MNAAYAYLSPAGSNLCSFPQGSIDEDIHEFRHITGHLFLPYFGSFHDLFGAEIGKQHPQEGARRQVRGEAPEQPFFLERCEISRQGARRPVNELMVNLPDLPGVEVNFSVHDLDQGLSLLEARQELGGNGSQCQRVREALQAREKLPKRRQEHVLTQKLLEQPLLGAEMPEKGQLGYTGSPRDLPRGGAQIPFFRDELEGCVKQSFSRAVFFHNCK